MESDEIKALKAELRQIRRDVEEVRDELRRYREAAEAGAQRLWWRLTSLWTYLPWIMACVACLLLDLHEGRSGQGPAFAATVLTGVAIVARTVREAT